MDLRSDGFEGNYNPMLRAIQASKGEEMSFTPQVKNPLKLKVGEKCYIYAREYIFLAYLGDAVFPWVVLNPREGYADTVREVTKNKSFQK